MLVELLPDIKGTCYHILGRNAARCWGASSFGQRLVHPTDEPPSELQHREPPGHFGLVHIWSCMRGDSWTQTNLPGCRGVTEAPFCMWTDSSRWRVVAQWLPLALHVHHWTCAGENVTSWNYGIAEARQTSDWYPESPPRTPASPPPGRHHPSQWRPLYCRCCSSRRAASVAAVLKTRVAWRGRHKCSSWEGGQLRWVSLLSSRTRRARPWLGGRIWTFRYLSHRQPDQWRTTGASQSSTWHSRSREDKSCRDPDLTEQKAPLSGQLRRDRRVGYYLVDGLHLHSCLPSD